MKITVLGTGMVGQAIASKMLKLGHSVIMGTRNPEETRSRTEANPMTGSSFTDWYRNNTKVRLEKYSNCTDGSELIINATSGSGSIDALRETGKNHLTGKVLLDIANPLNFSNGMPPTLFVSNNDSLAEQIQKEFPLTKVVKSLNTLNAHLMVNPSLLTGDHTIFISGNNAKAKEMVAELLKSMGWKKSNIIDLGNIKSARGTEQLLPIWIQLMGVLGTADFNFHIVRK